MKSLPLHFMYIYCVDYTGCRVVSNRVLISLIIATKPHGLLNVTENGYQTCFMAIYLVCQLINTIHTWAALPILFLRRHSCRICLDHSDLAVATASLLPFSFQKVAGNKIVILPATDKLEINCSLPISKEVSAVLFI